MFFNNVNRNIFNIVVLIIIRTSKCTVDVNLSEYQYLSNHLHDEECRELVASLHFSSYDMPNALEKAERKVSKDVPCLQQLLHWNSEKGGGKGETHVLVSRRLTQIGREDLAKWLTKTSYVALEHEFKRNVLDSFEPTQFANIPAVNCEWATKICTLSYFSSILACPLRTTPPVLSLPNPPADATEWNMFDTLAWAVGALLFLIIIAVIIYYTLTATCCKCKKKKKKYEYLDNDEYVSIPVCGETYSCSGQENPPCTPRMVYLSPTSSPEIIN